jgi:hypothetical protein
VEAVLLWSRSIRGLTARSRADAPKSGASLNANVEAVGKPQNFAFSRQKVLGFQGSIFSKEPFSTASLDLTINLGYTMGRKEKRKTTVMTRRSSFPPLAE